MSPRARRASFSVTPLDQVPPARIVGEIVFVHCVVCDRMISNEDGHTCTLSPEYRAVRKEARDRKTTAVREWKRFERDEAERVRRRR